MDSSTLKQNILERIITDLGAEECASTVLTSKTVLEMLESYYPDIWEKLSLD